MGTPAFWDAGESFAGIMTEYYARISKKAMDVAYSDYEIHERMLRQGRLKRRGRRESLKSNRYGIIAWRVVDDSRID